MPEALNPFLAFSNEDLNGMEKEVEDILSGDSSSSEEGEEDVEIQITKPESSDDDSLTGKLIDSKAFLHFLLPYLMIFQSSAEFT